MEYTAKLFPRQPTMLASAGALGAALGCWASASADPGDHLSNGSRGVDAMVV